MTVVEFMNLFFADHVGRFDFRIMLFDVFAGVDEALDGSFTAALATVSAVDVSFLQNPCFHFSLSPRK